MRKTKYFGRHFLPLFMAALLCVGAVQGDVLAAGEVEPVVDNSKETIITETKSEIKDDGNGTVTVTTTIGSEEPESQEAIVESGDNEDDRTVTLEDGGLLEKTETTTDENGDTKTETIFSDKVGSEVTTQTTVTKSEEGAVEDVETSKASVKDDVLTKTEAGTDGEGNTTANASTTTVDGKTSGVEVTTTVNEKGEVDSTQTTTTTADGKVVTVVTDGTGKVLSTVTEATDETGNVTTTTSVTNEKGEEIVETIVRDKDGNVVTLPPAQNEDGGNDIDNTVKTESDKEVATETKVGEDGREVTTVTTTTTVNKNIETDDDGKEIEVTTTVEEKVEMTVRPATPEEIEAFEKNGYQPVVMPDGTVLMITFAVKKTTTTIDENGKEISRTVKEGVDVDDENELPFSDFFDGGGNSLGDAANFAVFAEEYEQSGDMEGNIAVGKLIYTTVLNAEEKKLTLVLGKPEYNSTSYHDNNTVNYIGSVDGEFSEVTINVRCSEDENGKAYLVLGEDVDVKVNKGAGKGEIEKINITDDKKQKIDFDKALENLNNYALKLREEPTTGVQETRRDDGTNLELDYDFKGEAGFHVVNVSINDLVRNNGNGINFEGIDENVTVLVNVTDIDNNVDNYDVKLKQQINSGKSESEGWTQYAGNILFNFGDYAGEIVYSGDGGNGSVLAPRATVKITTGHLDGNVIARKVQAEKEIHRAGAWKGPEYATPTPDGAGRPDGMIAMLTGFKRSESQLVSRKPVPTKSPDEHPTSTPGGETPTPTTPGTETPTSTPGGETPTPTTPGTETPTSEPGTTPPPETEDPPPERSVPEPDPTPPDTPENPEDPGEPTPLEEIPDEPTPLAEIPDEPVPLTENPGIRALRRMIPDEDDILETIADTPVPLVEVPKEEVPLAEVPDEGVPLVEIPDEEVPLAEVPLTGDESGIWYVIVVMSAAALAVMNVLEKRKKKI
ncbi:MAG: doubled motif LPXTG anchor domain-containing protein [Lachnospiraceae bacterium]|jgi:choice-of-anchor A domain-containing protein|nr:doubled motif LPXTG anchor domain-containing protein [Lachnospiraceae bacterium]